MRKINVKTGTVKKLVGLAVLFFIVFGFYSIKLMSASTYVVKNQRIGTYMEKGVLTHMAYLKDNNLYGRRALMENYPIKLVDEFLINYTYTSKPTLENGRYIMEVTVEFYVNKGTKEVVLWKETLFKERGNLTDGKFSETYNLNVGEIENLSAEIEKVLGIRRLNRRVTIAVNVVGDSRIGEKIEKKEFSHEMELIKDLTSGLYYFTNTKKSESTPLIQRKTYPANASILGITGEVKTLRAVTTLLAVLMLIPILGYAYTSKPKKDPLKKLRPYIIEGKPGTFERKIELASHRDLEKTFDLIDRPILHYTDGDYDVYAILDGDTLYTFYQKSPSVNRKTQ